FEKFISEGYYYLATASLYSSRYQGGDRIWHDTRYNRNVAINILVGKEWLFGEEQNQIFGVSARLSYQGGSRYTPVNMTQSITNQDVVFNETKPFVNQFPPAFVSHLTISYKLNKENTAHEI